MSRWMACAALNAMAALIAVIAVAVHISDTHLAAAAVMLVAANAGVAALTRRQVKPRRIARLEREMKLPPSDLSYLGRGKRRR
jgi:hypothetical protein